MPNVRELANEILKLHEPNKYTFVISEVLLPESEAGVKRADEAYELLLSDGHVVHAPSYVSPMIFGLGVTPRKPFKLTESGIAKRLDLLSE